MSYEDDGVASDLSLTEGEGTASGTFHGTIQSGGQKMYFYFPASAASTTGVNLTKQNGSHTKEMVMFASAEYSTEPSIQFQNKTSILKLNIPVPAESGWTTSTTSLSATVYGAYSMGKLSKEGTWSDLSVENISVSNIKVSSDGKLTGYAVVISGTKVTDLRIAVTDGTNYYVTNAYTNAEATVPENNVVAISRATSKALVWKRRTTTADDVTSFLGTDGTDLTIVAAGEMDEDDFRKQLCVALESYSAGSINITLLNQNSFPVSWYGSFPECVTLKSIAAPNIKSVGRYSFRGCSNLSSVSLPNVTSMGSQSFYGCTSINTISLPKAESVGYNSFNNCTQLTSISLPKATSVGSQAFIDCTNRTSISLPKATTVNDYAFRGCTNLNYVSLPKSTSVSGEAFYNLDKSKISLFVKSEASWYGNESDWDTVYKDGVSVIIWIPGEKKAADVTSLIAANGNTLSIFSAEELGPTDFTEITSALKGMDVGSVNITLFNQTTLPDDAFESCNTINSISAPKATSIGKRAFYYCKYLTSVDFPEVISVDEEGLRSCMIQSLSLPKAKTLGKDAIAACKSLGSVSMPEVETVGEEAFGMSNMKSVSLPKAKSVGKNAFNYCDYLKSIELPEATSVEYYTFGHCDVITSVSIPKATSVGKSAFSGCIALATISLPNAITVENNAFDECKVLKYLYLQSATTVASNAFAYVDKSKINVYVKRGTTWWNPWTDWGTVSEQ